MPETPTDLLAFVCALSRRHTEALGFLPRPTLATYVAQGRVLVAWEQDAPCGFLVRGNGWPVLNIYQLCIAHDAQRLRHGLTLVQQALAYATVQGYTALACWCAEELEANLFWQAVGFHAVARRARPNRRHRTHIRWVRWLETPVQGRLWYPTEDTPHA